VKGRIAALIMAVLLLFYIVISAQWAILLIRSGEPVGVAMGVVAFLLPLLALWALGRELLFGVQSERLMKTLEAEGGLPIEEVPVLQSGRRERAAADADFPRWAEAVEQSPESWRDWARLGLAYDASGDRKRARSSIRTAIRLERQERR
jgi:hypothetical protein